MLGTVSVLDPALPIPLDMFQTAEGKAAGVTYQKPNEAGTGLDKNLMLCRQVAPLNLNLPRFYESIVVHM
jgi:hypothetical protein